MSTKQLALAPETPAAITPMEMLSMAVSQNADLDKLTKLMELQERWEKNEARKAFNVAFSAFKAESVTIVKGQTVKDGPLKDKKYADLFNVVSAITPVLSKHGLSHSWALTKDDPTWMEVTCTIRHELGHFESVSMGAAPDAGPGRNAIQARCSATNYLERYTLLAVTGHAAGGEDNDGNGLGEAAGMPEAEFTEKRTWIESAETPERLKVAFQAAYKAAEAVKDRNAASAFIAARDKRKAEIK